MQDFNTQPWKDFLGELAMYTYFQIQDKSCHCFVSLVYTCRYSLGNYCPALIVSGFHC